MFAMGHGCGILFSIVFVGFAAFFIVISSSMGAPPLFQLVPLILVAVGLGIGIHSTRKTLAFRSAPLLREPALVVGERTSVSGGGENRSASTTCFLTLENPEGDRREFVAAGRTVGIVSEGDMGVALPKGDVLLDFLRIRV